MKVERHLKRRGIRGSCGGDLPGDVSKERRRRDTEAVRDLGYANIRVGQQRFGALDVVVAEFRRTPSVAAKATGGGEARLGTLPDETPLKFCECHKHVKDQPPLCGRRV